jgi:ATP-dependent Clp protease ATP-binding subunit ClpC
VFEKFSDSARRVLFYARYEASQTGSPHIGTEHLLLGLLKETEDVVREIFARCKVSIPELQAEVEAQIQRGDKVSTSDELPLHESCKKALHFALDEAKKLLHGHVSAEHLLLGLLRHKDSTAGAILHEHGMQLYEVREHVVAIVQKKAVGKKKKERPLLEEFSRNLNAIAAEGAFDPLVGREREIQRIMQILSRRRKNNPVLLGEPGVGKTAIVEGLAQRINDGDVPPSLQTKNLVALDLSLIVAGTKYRGQFEERLKGILKELSENPDTIVFIDEIHNLIGAGSAEGSLDAASILKPALSRGEIQCIGATTFREYHRYIEKDRALVRRFQPIKIGSPDEAETLRIVRGVQERYERFHRVRYSDDALSAAVTQSNRYITDRALPDKAIDVLDEAGARVKLRRAAAVRELRRAERQLSDYNERIHDAITKRDFDMAMFYREEEEGLLGDIDRLRTDDDEYAAVSEDDVEEVISTWTSVPIQSLKMDETEKLLRIEGALHERVIGQEEGITYIARAIRRSRSGLKDPRRPIGSFLFLGPTGVGKTEVAKAVAEYLFNDEGALVRFDMSEYMEVHAVAKMIGSPPGYVGHEEGGALTKKLREQPYSVLLLDEVEKAHPDILNVLLQILDEGHVTDAHGERVDCKNTIIIMTSNIGSRALDRHRSLGFTEGTASAPASERDRREVVMREVKRLLSPEFINRIDEIVLFHPLSEPQLEQVVDLLVRRLNRQLERRNVRIETTPEVAAWIVAQSCKDRAYGARPLRRGLQRHIEDPLSEEIIRAGGMGDDLVVARVSVKDGELAFSVERKKEDPKLAPVPV